MTSTALIRPAWTPATIALTVIGFMVFWPLGFAMLAYVLWGDRLNGFKRDVNGATDRVWARFRPQGFSSRTANWSATGNVAFDDWRAKELDRLDAERRKLDEMYQEFDAYARELRRAKDQDEFDRFMADRGRAQTDAAANKPKNGDALLDG